MLVYMGLAGMTLNACAVKPPVQEMAEARSSVHMAHQLSGKSGDKNRFLQSAEASLREASLAIQEKRYEHARIQALKARREAQRAVKILRTTQPAL